MKMKKCVRSAASCPRSEEVNFLQSCWDSTGRPRLLRKATMKVKKKATTVLPSSFHALFLQVFLWIFLTWHMLFMISHFYQVLIPENIAEEKLQITKWVISGKSFFLQPFRPNTVEESTFSSPFNDIMKEKEN